MQPGVSVVALSQFRQQDLPGRDVSARRLCQTLCQELLGLAPVRPVRALLNPLAVHVIVCVPDWAASVECHRRLLLPLASHAYCITAAPPLAPAPYDIIPSRWEPDHTRPYACVGRLRWTWAGPRHSGGGRGDSELGHEKPALPRPDTR